MKRKVPILSLILICLVKSAWASGFRIPEQGTAAMGMANAWVAQADGPSGLFMNAAGIAQLASPSFEAGVTAIQPSITHTDAEGDDTSTEDRLFYLPSVYITDDMTTDTWAFGIGLSYPFGLGTRWADDSFARYASTTSDIELMNINPTLAWKATDSLFLGIGADYYRSKVTLEKKVWMGPGNPDNDFSLKGDGEGWGYNAGLIYRFGSNYSLGLAYRSQVAVDHDGTARLTDDTGHELLKSAGSAGITYPAMAQAGFAARIGAAFLVELDVEWTDWSVYDSLDINFANDALDDKHYTKDWEDTYTFRLGMDYRLSKVWDIKAGYVYDQSPVPDAHFDTLLPDGGPRQGLTLGCGYRSEQFTMDIAYMALFISERSVKANNPDLANDVTGSYDPDLGGTDVTGKYKGYSNLLAISLSWLF